MDEPRRRVLLPGNERFPGTAETEDKGEPCECPFLEAEEWDGVESDWKDITFLSASVAAVAGVPVGFQGARSELQQRAAELGVVVPKDAMLLIGEGRFRRRVLLEVEPGELGADRELYRPGGFAFSRLVQAPWGELARAAKRVRNEAEQRYGRGPTALYAWYLTCRTCSRERNFETLLVAHYAP
ncbi:MAG: hypothetical protein KatS3mg062_0153 [Tepidiforma sp.]|nr:MAG: hypothetical protein KatS3mg062_0153 [Tepidiforma sp.]